MQLSILFMASTSNNKKGRGHICPNCGHLNKKSATWCRECKQELKPIITEHKTSIVSLSEKPVYVPPDDYEESTDFFRRAEKISLNRKDIEHIVEEIKRRGELQSESIKYFILITLGLMVLRAIIILFFSNAVKVESSFFTVIDIFLSTAISEFTFIYSVFLLGSFITLLADKPRVSHRMHWRIIPHLYPALFTAAIFWVSSSHRTIVTFFTVILFFLAIIMGLLLLYDLIIVVKFEYGINYIFAFIVSSLSIFLRYIIFLNMNLLFNNLIHASYQSSFLQ